ncbi:UNVERIFIED_CONTAM: hypothetical protein BEN50_02875 [Euhalothece sp. KZN 001]
MTRFLHDQFAKDYLETLLEPFGKVESSRRVSGEAQQIDAWFEPSRENLSGLEALGVLGKMAKTPSIFEPHRNPVTPDEICDCLLKWLLVKGESKRQARRNQTPFSLEKTPQLWILTPTASVTVLSGFNAVSVPNELRGFYTLGNSLRTNIIILHQLPRIPETLWLRVLGRDRVQREAIDELENLTEENPFRQVALELLYTLRENLELKEELELEERELIMRLAPLYQQKKEKLQQEAEQRGKTIAQREIAQKLFRQGMEINQIAELTELSVEEIAKLNRDTAE